MKIICQTPFLEFKSTKSPSGNEWHYVKRTNDNKEHDSAVVITTIVKNTNGYNFLFLKTLRPPISAEHKAQYCLESPAGLIGDENDLESLLECSKKELLEEAGYVADELFFELKNSSTSAGLSSETISYATAFVNSDRCKKEPVDDGGIIIERILVPLTDIYSFLKNVDTSKISISSVTVCGLFFALERFKNLQ